MKNKQIHSKMFVVVRGLAKARKSLLNDNNILSVIKSNFIMEGDSTVASLVKKIDYADILKNATWQRPFKLNKIEFNLQDFNSMQSILV